MLPTERGSKSRHRDHRLMKRARHGTLATTRDIIATRDVIDLNASTPLPPSKPSPPTPPSMPSATLSSFIPDEVIVERMDHLLQKNYTKSDPLTLSTTKARDYVKDAVAAQQEIRERARRIDANVDAGFADLEIRCVTLLSNIPSQKKVTKPAIITFLCHLHIIIKEIQRKSAHPSRFTILSSFIGLMEKVEMAARELLSSEMDTSRRSLLKTKVLSKEEKKRKYLEGGGKAHQHFSTCVKCGHGYVDLPPSNDTLHDKFMAQLSEYTRLKDAVEKYEEDQSDNPPPLDADGN